MMPSLSTTRKPKKSNPNKEDRAKIESDNKRKYKVLRKAYLIAHPICEHCNEKGATSIHHKARQKGFNRFRFFMATCPECHTWIHDHSTLAKKLRYIFTYDRNREDIDEEAIEYEEQDD